MDFNPKNTSNKKTQLKRKNFNYKMNEKFEQTLHKEGPWTAETNKWCSTSLQSDKSKSSPQRDTTTSVCPGDRQDPSIPKGGNKDAQTSLGGMQK